MRGVFKFLLFLTIFSTATFARSGGTTSGGSEVDCQQDKINQSMIPSSSAPSMNPPDITELGRMCAARTAKPYVLGDSYISVGSSEIYMCEECCRNSLRLSRAAANISPMSAPDAEVEQCKSVCTGCFVKTKDPNSYAINRRYGLCLADSCTSRVAGARECYKVTLPPFCKEVTSTFMPLAAVTSTIITLPTNVIPQVVNPVPPRPWGPFIPTYPAPIQQMGKCCQPVRGSGRGYCVDQSVSCGSGYSEFTNGSVVSCNMNSGGCP